MQRTNFIQSFKVYEANKGKSFGKRLTPKQIQILNFHTLGAWEINQETDLVDIIGSFYVTQPVFTKPKEIEIFKKIRFGKVTGVFHCIKNFFQDLEGFPQEVEEHFNCSDNVLTSLQGGPVKVGKTFNCSNNNLKDLIGGPEKVDGIYYSWNNPLTSLVGAPEKVKNGFFCDTFGIQKGDWNYSGWIEALKEAKEKKFPRAEALISTLPFLDVNFLKDYLVIKEPDRLVRISIFWKNPIFADFRKELEKVLDPQIVKYINSLSNMSGYFTNFR